MTRLAGRAIHDQRGLTVLEILVASTLMIIVAGAISTLIGASVQAKMISAGWTNDTQSARKTLAWMADRVRQAGFNVDPKETSPVNQVGYPTRCRDRIVAQDSTMYPTTSAVYFSGEIPFVSGSPGSSLTTIGYYLGTDATTGNAVIMEYNQICSAGADNIAGNSTELSNPKSNVTNLTFSYYDSNGSPITGASLSTPSSIQKIAIVGIALTVQTTEAKYGKQTEVYLQRYVRLWDPEPNANNSNNGWVDQNENY